MHRAFLPALSRRSIPAMVKPIIRSGGAERLFWTADVHVGSSECGGAAPCLWAYGPLRGRRPAPRQRPRALRPNARASVCCLYSRGCCAPVGQEPTRMSAVRYVAGPLRGQPLPCCWALRAHRGVKRRAPGRPVSCLSMRVIRLPHALCQRLSDMLRQDRVRSRPRSPSGPGHTESVARRRAHLSNDKCHEQIGDSVHYCLRAGSSSIESQGTRGVMSFRGRPVCHLFGSPLPSALQ